MLRIMSARRSPSGHSSAGSVRFHANGSLASGCCCCCCSFLVFFFLVLEGGGRSRSISSRLCSASRSRLASKSCAAARRICSCRALLSGHLIIESARSPWLKMSRTTSGGLPASVSTRLRQIQNSASSVAKVAAAALAKSSSDAFAALRWPRSMSIWASWMNRRQRLSSSEAITSTLASCLTLAKAAASTTSSCMSTSPRTSSPFSWKTLATGACALCASLDELLWMRCFSFLMGVMASYCLRELVAARDAKDEDVIQPNWRLRGVSSESSAWASL
eukprot:scaffold1720_cov238-Pinguiococcus_pyrenoidosus.AAC.4